MTTAALIVAAGRGHRASQDGSLPKQYQRIGGRTVLARSTQVFLDNPEIANVVVVIHQDDTELYARSIDNTHAKLLQPVHGGATRQESVFAGLLALSATNPQRVLIHDAARPYVSTNLIATVLDALEDADGAIPAVAVADTLKRASHDRRIIETVERAGLWRAQTPQGFRYRQILAAHEAADSAQLTTFTDDASIAEWRNLDVAIVEGENRNIKLTTAEDLVMAEQAMVDRGTPTQYETRTATGFDVHKLGPGSHMWLCGVRIPHTQTLVGHSDADVGMHALTDALLGTIGEGDIGTHFPPSDDQWKGAASDVFLKDAVARIRARAGKIIHTDLTLICEQPKIGPLREDMRITLAKIMGVPAARVSVKATTSETLGFTGRGEGIAALATATVRLPAEP